jgi:hypothetical protein
MMTMNLDKALQSVATFRGHALSKLCRALCAFKGVRHAIYH